jgi:hypothetical protein
MTMTTRKTSLRLASLLGPIAPAATVMASSPAAADDGWYSPGISCPSQYQYGPYCYENPSYGLYPPGFYPYYGDWNYNFRSHDFDHRHNDDHHDGPHGGFNHDGNFNHGGGAVSHSGGGHR